MKRFFITMLLAAVATTSFAQNWQELFSYDLSSGEYRTYFKIDRDAKFFSFDADGDQNNPIKNYKKVGNKETFDVYVDYMPNQLCAKVELTLVPEMEKTKIKTTADLEKQIIKVTHYPDKRVETFGIKLKSQGGNYPFHDDDPTAAATDKVKEGATKLFNKGKDLIQKQKEKREAKKEAKKEVEKE
ncbi:MAG: hypothetical protein J6R57_03395 [Bacteroidales bacterium]|nr:hypothetical protein [Bacteroidales bacterium]